MNLLFVCKYNRFRSKVAEALFLHYNKNKNINVKSAGMNIDVLRPFIAKSVLEVLEGRKIKVPDQNSRKVDDYLINWADKIVVSADNVDLKSFPADKVIQWDIPDASEHDMAAILISMKLIEEQIKRLVDKLR
jgi:protein-tyrosine-phosphatase